MVKKRVLLLTNIISPYMNDLFNHLSSYEEIDLTVKACSDREPDRKWSLDFLNTAKYRYEILRDVFMMKQPGKNRVVYLGGLSVIQEILRNRYDVIIFKGGTRLVGPLSALAAKFSKTETVLWEQNSFYTTNTPMKKVFKKIYINNTIFNKFIAYGEQVKELVLDFNPNAEVFTALSPINNDKYRNNYLKFRRKRDLIRKKLGISPDERAILYVGRFVKEKNLTGLLTAAEKLRTTGEFPFKILLVGGGDLEKSLEQGINLAGLEKQVRLVPFQDFNRLSMFYTAADLFVLPSVFEPWGLVVNEAMNFNLPVVVSDRVGCANSLVMDGYNGFVYNLHNNDEFAEKITEALRDSARMGKNSAKIIQNVGFKQVCETLVALTGTGDLL